MNYEISIAAAFVFGTLIGSFLNVVIWRLPRGKNLRGRSHCPHCGHVLRPQELFPVFSYLFLRGRCAKCGKRISPRYMFIELITGALFALAALHILPAAIDAVSIIELLRILFILAILISVFVIDLEHYLILDVIVFPAAAITFALNIVLDVSAQQSVFALSSNTAGGVLAAMLAAGFFYIIWRVSAGKWMGFGDVKFSIFLGLALGWTGILVGLFLAFMIGAVVGVLLLIAGTKSMQSRLPFGTFLTLGALLALFYGPQLANWYGRLIGV